MTRGMWNLFMAMCGDPSGMVVVLDKYPSSLLFCAAYMVVTSFGILSILTALVCDKMTIAAQEHMSVIHEERHKLKVQYAEEKLDEIFYSLVRDQKEGLDKDQFELMMQNNDMVTDICGVLNFQQFELEKAWDALSKGEKMTNKGEPVPCISYNDFVQGLLHAKRDVNNLSLMRIEKRVAVVERALKRIHESLERQSLCNHTTMKAIFAQLESMSVTR